MAEAVVFHMAIEILEKLCSIALQEVGLLCGVKDELHKLANTVSTIKAVFLDAEEQHATSHAVRDWLAKLKHAVYDADDLLDDFFTEFLRRQVMKKTRNKMANKVLSFFSSSNQLVFGLKMGHKVKAIRERLDAIAADRNKFHFIEQPRDQTRVKIRDREQTHSFVPIDGVIGRDDDKRAIVELLLADSNFQENVSIIPIVGIGGVGKTTLAQFVYNDETVQKHFELKLWVCVSDVFDVKLIVEKITESATKKKPENLEMDLVQNILRETINGKKYLLVLDDVWNENRGRWLKLSDLLMGGARGSKIVVTTRSKVVAAVMGTVQPYVLEGLPEGNSWSLFKQMAFRPGQEVKNPGLVPIGMEIVRKCGGVPLAIRTLGSLLYLKDTETEWLSFKNNELWRTDENENVIQQILKLSYDHLPSHLKYCFAYCSLFPKDYSFDKHTLINLWMAQGFVKSINRNQLLEDAGDEYFMDLYRRCFFQDIETDEFGNVKSCKMHDLIHDLAQLVAGTESCIADLDGQNLTQRIRHVSFAFSLDFPCKIPTLLRKVKHIRTFLLPCNPWLCGILNKSTFKTLISCYRCLRVLDLHNSGVKKVPSSIGKLKHLRYLDLSNNIFRILPRSITRLQHLQTLILCGCYALELLPSDITKLVSLRHLKLDGCVNLIHMPFGLGQLTSLQTLTRFAVGPNNSIFRLSGGLSELNGLINLKGELTISNLGCLKSAKTEAKEANLKGKQCLHSLRLEWVQEAHGSEEDEILLECLQPPPNLKKLQIEGYRGTSFPSWMMVNIELLLTNLVEITIKNCNRCQHLPPFRLLPSLQVLNVSNMTSLEYIENCSDNDHHFHSASGRPAVFFPSLKKLTLFNLPQLKGWWMREAVASARATTSKGEKQQQQQSSPLPPFPSLSKSTIKDCPNFVSMPMHIYVEELYLREVSQNLLQQQLMLTTETVAASSALLPLSKLKSLYIEKIKDLVSLPEEGLQNLTFLEHLEIWCCPKLLNLPGEGLKGLTSLRFLTIHACERLTSLSWGMRHLTALEKLEINNCSELDLLDNEGGMEFQGLRSLTSLVIYDIPKLVSLPVGLQYVTTIQSLQISCCDSLMALPEWIDNLTSLRELRIHCCPKLASLPEGMRCLSSLQLLSIVRCPHLNERCLKETGEDWLKISHIPTVTFEKV